ncbi:MAG: aminoacyl-tRNA hydrolase [Candidatus Omnitrophica bacterium]|nr:aminoacyl-tRNA hydrolase [Candidatus Omnitrophota bacterium]MCB9747607.1 aminoacyl-tRNA hydrolase [Candidatus Omnitrophota bacterium]
MPELRLIVGLGNPGKEYCWTRHNLGFLVLEKLAERFKVEFRNSSFTKGLIAKTEYDNCELVFLKPITFMNNSGSAVKPSINQLLIKASQMLVICDDFQLDYGQLRLRAKGSDGGHNGLASIIDVLQAKDFPRLRMGIGAPPSKEGVVEYVLDKFSKKEMEGLEDFVSRAADCCLSWAKDGLAIAMERYNRKVKEDEYDGENRS